MKSIYFAFLILFLGSCNPAAPKKEEPQPVRQENHGLKLKPLSTEKTHEGGMDTTKLRVKK